VINFRVTDEELAHLKAASAALGSRCLSDFARTVILRSAESTGADGAGPNERPRIETIERRIALLEAHLVLLAGALGGARAAAGGVGVDDSAPVRMAAGYRG
jgi:hypothetical protein